MKPTAQKIKHYLDQNNISYWTTDFWLVDPVSGETVTELQTIDEVVRCQLIDIEGKLAVVAVGSLEEFDLDEMRMFLKTQDIQLVGEAECHRLFPGCDATALPALGNVCGMPVYCTQHVLQNKNICFNSGTHDEIITLSTSDFIKVAKPIVGNFARSAIVSSTAAYYW